jgi:hypothetical protein
VSYFCAEIQLSGKILENTAKSYFTRRPTEPEYETERGEEGTTPPGGGGQAWPRLGVVWQPQPSPRAPFCLHIPFDLKLSGVRCFSQIEFRCAATIRIPDSKPENPFWHPAGTGIWRRSSPSSSPMSLHQPSMIPPSMCEKFPLQVKGMVGIG